jgi:hypothetical protein
MSTGKSLRALTRLTLARHHFGAHSDDAQLLHLLLDLLLLKVAKRFLFQDPAQRMNKLLGKSW